MDVSDLSFLSRPVDNDPARTVINETYALLDNLGIRSPALEFALRWASERAPAPQRITFVHGDFRIGNMLVTPQGLSAVIDWEFGHIGDPIEEIGYLCMRDWRFGNGRLRAAGLSDRELFITAYEQASGHTVERSAADWWELVGNIRWGVICLAQAERHLSGKDPSVELASLGRRSAEMQFEALRIIEMIETKA
jgi:aminoglycoside phosphotransferase (APT) family kinase protein